MSVKIMYSEYVEPFCRVKEHDGQTAFSVCIPTSHSAAAAGESTKSTVLRRQGPCGGMRLLPRILD